ncbi:MAG: hypothetical protein RIT45_1568 [Pseudomonadota bacterium]|jgi:hypothetical protein
MARYELETLEISGSPLEMGLQQGRHFGARLGQFVDMRFEAARTYLADHGGFTLEGLLGAGERCYEVLQRWHPNAVVEHEAMASEAGVDAIRLFTAANMTDIRDVLLLSGDGPGAAPPADSEGCTAVLVTDDHARDGCTLVGQTWDLNIGDLDYVVAIHRRPDNRPEAWTVTVAGAPSLMGMNAAGIAIGTTNIKTWRSRPGVGYLNILHRMLGCSSRAEAARVVETAPRSGAHTYWIADASGFVEYEATPYSVTTRDGSAGPLCRTNHCLHEPNQILEGEAPSPSSYARLERVQSWLSHGNQDVESLQRLFADRSDGIESINRLPEDDQGTATNAVLIAIPERLELWACRGPSNRGEWRHLPFRIGGERGTIG